MELDGYNVGIVDDDPAVTDSIKMLLETIGCRVTTYSNGIEFLDSDLRGFVGCVLLDVRMPIKDGLTVLTEALTINPNLQIVMMSGHGDIPMAVKALKNGAVDFIEKPFQATVILETMEKACARLKDKSQDQLFVTESKSRFASLTNRELEISNKLVEGKPNKIIAFELGISIRTVETHRARILSKMQVRSLAELVKMQLAAMG
ncbi:MAG: response regulator [Litorimonas sp.]